MFGVMIEVLGIGRPRDEQGEVAAVLTLDEIGRSIRTLDIFG